MNTEQKTTAEYDHQPSLPLKVSTLFLLVLFLLMVFQSSALVTLSYDLPTSATTEAIIAHAETWHGWMEALGATDITQTVRDQIETAHEVTVVN